MTDVYVPLAGDAPPVIEDLTTKQSFVQEAAEEQKVIDFKTLLKQHR